LSTDGGKSFSSKFTYSPAAGNGCLLAGAFFDGTNIFVGTSAGLLVSSNNGTSFALANVSGIPSTQAMFSFAGAKQGGVTRFLCVALNASDVYPGMDIEGYYGSYQSVYGLDWGQSSWAVRTSGILAGHEPVFVAMARNDTGTAYVAGQQSSIDYPVLYKSSNGGVNWSPVLLITNNQNVYTGWAGNGGDRDWSYGAGALGLAVSPLDSSKVMYTDLGFAHLSTNGGAFWRQVYVSPSDQNTTNAATPRGKAYHSIGLENTSCWQVMWSDSNHLV